MGIFVDRVRNGDILHPFSHGFSLDAWRLQYRGSDAYDFSLHTAGMTMHSVVDQLLRRFRRPSGNPACDRACLGALIRDANRFYCTLQMNVFGSAMDSSTVLNVNHLRTERHPTHDYTLDEIVDSLGDSVLFPVRDLVTSLKLTGRTRKLAESVVPPTEADVAEVILICQHFYFFRLLWMDLLWGSAMFGLENYGHWIIRYDRDVEAKQRIAERRRDIDHLSNFMHLQRTTGMSADDSSVRVAVARFKNGYVTLRTTRKNSDSRTRQVTVRRSFMWAFRLYFFGDAFGDLILGKVGPSVSLSDGVEYVAALHALGPELERVCQERANESASELACLITAGELNHYIQRVTGIPIDKVVALTAFISFTGERNQDLHTCPLVPVGETELMIFQGGLVSSPTRTIDALMKRGCSNEKRSRSNVNVRGAKFEQVCRWALGRMLEASCFSGDCWNSRGSITLSRRQGDIDAAFRIAETLVLAEVKYLGYPVDANEYANCEKTLRTASDKIRRKANTVDPDSPALMEHFSDPGVQPSRISKVVPIIIVNGPYGAGFPMDGIPVADLDLLATFFSNEYVEEELSGWDQPIKQRTCQIYRDAREGQAILGDWLLEPELIKRLMPKLRERENTDALMFEMPDGSPLVVTRKGFELIERDLPMRIDIAD